MVTRTHVHSQFFLPNLEWKNLTVNMKTNNQTQAEEFDLEKSSKEHLQQVSVTIKIPMSKTRTQQEQIDASNYQKKRPIPLKI